MKFDRIDLCKRVLDWKDNAPFDLIPKWKINFDNITQFRGIKFKHCIFPDDAVSLDMDTIEKGDCSFKLAFSANYIRFKRKNGQY